MQEHIEEELAGAEEYIKMLHEHQEHACIFRQMAWDEYHHAEHLIWIAEHEGIEVPDMTARLAEVKAKLLHKHDK